MKKKLYLIIIFLLFISCGNTKNNSTIEKDKKLIKNFIENILVNRENNYESIIELSNKYSQIRELESKKNGRKNLDSLIQIAYREGNKKNIKKLNKQYNELQISKIESHAKNRFEEALKLNIDNNFINSNFSIYNKTKKDSLSIIETIGQYSAMYKESYDKESWQDYKIIHYSEVKNHANLLKSDMYLSLEYNKLKSIYFVMFDNKTNRVMLFTIENNKIISFFPHLVFGVGPTKPYLLNEKP
ncbi:hypothetical protein [uncultured Algibacter sp.]|uniref:hypothetical protein n=1 Tax=uncultured Algibacter sp. TaxID=298659 RepID=UPI0026055A77|nr:hypothetical protein [uncultured Algibacter sp.]